MRTIAARKKQEEDLYAGIVNALLSAWFYELSPRMVFRAIREGTTGNLARSYRGLKKRGSKPRSRRSKRRSR